MIRGAHVVLYSADAEADRAFFRDVLGDAFVDAGHGWLIFALPPAELAIHPATSTSGHEMFLMCDDVEGFIAQMTERGVACSTVRRERWGWSPRSPFPAAERNGFTSRRTPRRHAEHNLHGLDAVRGLTFAASSADPRYRRSQ